MCLAPLSSALAAFRVLTECSQGSLGSRFTLELQCTTQATCTYVYILYRHAHMLTCLRVNTLTVYYQCVHAHMYVLYVYMHTDTHTYVHTLHMARFAPYTHVTLCTNVLTRAFTMVVHVEDAHVQLGHSWAEMQPKARGACSNAFPRSHSPASSRQRE